jgi:hypothetical protein
MLLFAFGVGLANFASGRDVPPQAVVSAIADEIVVVASYGSTGNVAIEDGDIDEIRSRLAAITGTAWAGISSDELEDDLRTLGTMPSPQPSSQEERATPGLAFAVTPGRDGPLVSNERAVLHRLAIDIVAVWKLDLLDDSRLDRDRRRGGWGAVSADISRQVGGRWTARSRRTLDGLCARVEARRR